jgi:hypothetical protein
VLVIGAFAAFAVPASAQAGVITVDQNCIDVGTPETGGGLVSGTFSGAPFGSQYDPQGFVMAGHNPGDDQHNYGGESATVDAAGNGSFSFNLASYYGSSLPDTLWIKLLVVDRSVNAWVNFAELQVPVCGRGEPTPDPDPEPIYAFDGFYAPVNNRDPQGNFILNKTNAGAAIPVKFSLGGDYGLDIFETGYPRSEVIACDSQAEVDGIEETVTAGSSSLSYAAGSDTYTYVWKTSKAWEDSCRQLVVKFDDGTTTRANFKFH